MSPFGGAYDGARVLLTGHTGFKGAWLTCWLERLGASVVGAALDPQTDPALYTIANTGAGIDDRRVDIRDAGAVASLVNDVEPTIVLHLAAQAIVRESYHTPVETLNTNVMGTAHVLEAVRQRGAKCPVVVVTSDKCYENVNRHEGYRESDPMGGSDPYSMSKGACELVVASWRRSFMGADSPTPIATARAGNVIGGGDWAADRILTDCIHALCTGAPIGVRNPPATRPWQHVLEPLSGYLWLGALLLGDHPERAARGWNFGPAVQSVCSVRTLVEMLIEVWGSGLWDDLSDPNALHEAKLLALNWDNAYHQIGWQPAWSLRQCLTHTAGWYRAWHDGADSAALRALCERQIEQYESDAAAHGAAWMAGER